VVCRVGAQAPACSVQGRLCQRSRRAVCWAGAQAPGQQGIYWRWAGGAGTGPAPAACMSAVSAGLRGSRRAVPWDVLAWGRAPCAPVCTLPWLGMRAGRRAHQRPHPGPKVAGGLGGGVVAGEAA
jgi:hypothetical protein